MKRLLAHVLATLIISLCLNSTSYAAPIYTDHGDYTTINGMDWLDLSLTGGMSVNTALATYTDYRVATESEYHAMFSHFYDHSTKELETTTGSMNETTYNVTASDNTGSGYFRWGQRDAPIQQNFFSGLFGYAYTEIEYANGDQWALNMYSQGFYVAAEDEDQLHVGGLNGRDGTGYVGAADYGNIFYDYIGFYSFDYSHENNGTFLVKYTDGHSVPEPATMLLFGTGLVGLIGFRRRKKA